MKRAALILLALIGAAAAIGLPLAVNSEPVRTRLLAAAERATGHPVRIGGPIKLAPGSLVALAPAISAENVAILNAPGFSRPELLTARRIEAVIALIPLLAGHVELRSITIEQPDALFERDRTGRSNWQPEPAPPETNTPTAPSHPRTPPQIGPVRIEAGHLAAPGLPPIDIRALTLTPSGGPIDGNLVINNTALALAGTWDPQGSANLTLTAPGLALALSRSKEGPIAFQATAANLATLSTLAGAKLPDLHDIHLTGQTTGPSLKLLGQATYAALPISAALDATLSPQGPAALQITADGATISAQGTADWPAHRFEGTLSANLPDLRRTGALAGLTLPPLQAAAITVRLLPPPSGDGLLLRGLRLTSTQGDLAGDLAWTQTPRPALRGSLVAQQWNLDTWPGPVPTPPPQAAPSPPTAPASPATLEPPQPFAWLNRADTDLHLAVAQATDHGSLYRNLEAHAVLKDGRLRLDPLRLQSPAGLVEGQLALDAAAAPPVLALTLHAPGLDAAALAAAAAFPGAVTGRLDLDADLQATGTQWHQLASHLTGHLAAALADGEVENALLAQLFGPALRGANLPLEPTGRSRVRCIVARLDATDGQARIGPLTLDTTRLRLEGEGTLDLAAETMDMHLRPTIRIGGAGVAIPVRLTGPFRAPHATADKGVLAPGRFGISIAQLGAAFGATAPDPCGPALTALRESLVR